jgi:signal peptidase I
VYNKLNNKGQGGELMENEQEKDILTPKEKKLDFGKNLLLYVHDLSYLIAIMMIVFLLLFRVVVVSGSSMEDTLKNGDYLLLLSNVFFTEPKQGDVIVASIDSFENGIPIVKRFIAVAGQTVRIEASSGHVYVDGELIEENYIYHDPYYTYERHYEITVDEGCIFVMGDHRRVSFDSRNGQIGLLDKREVLGKAIFLFLPGVDEITKTRDFSRIRVLP